MKTVEKVEPIAGFGNIVDFGSCFRLISLRNCAMLFTRHLKSQDLLIVKVKHHTFHYGLRTHAGKPRCGK